MPLDSRILLAGKAPEIESPLNMMMKAQSLKGLVNQNQEADRTNKTRELLRQSYKNNTVMGDDGSSRVDQKAVLSDLYKVDPELAMAKEQQLTKMEAGRQQMDMQKTMQQVQIAKQLAWSINDPQSYQAVRAKSIEMGLPNSENLPQEYDPRLVERMKMATLDASEQLAQQNNNKKFDFEKQKFQASQNLEQQKLAAQTGPASLTEAEKSVDKDFAKQYTKYTATGRNNAVNTIDKLEQLANEVAQDTGFGEAGGTRLPIPDMFRSRLAIERRDDARNFANKTLKELFGGQLSDGEREAAAREFWNDSLDNESNAKRLQGKIKELRDNVKTQDQMAQYYEQNRTLKGFKPVFNDQELQVGTVEDNYVFKGGDPADPSSWEPVTSSAQRGQ